MNDVTTVNIASLIKLAVSNYNEVLEKTKDPVVDQWPLMESPGPILCIIGTYLVFVLKVGPKMMEKRQAFQLSTILILYNAFQVIFSIWILTMISEFDVKELVQSYGCNMQTRLDVSDRSLQEAWTRSIWWYLMAKIIELSDTVFFVLRKKQNQVTFLHVYHHTIMATGTWFYLKLLPGLQAAIPGALNTAVHVIMYSYYLIAALGPKYKKYLWWKKYITLIQLVSPTEIKNELDSTLEDSSPSFSALQFLIIMSYLMLTLYMCCEMPKTLTYFFLMNIVMFIYLFRDFYLKAYKTKTT